MLMGKAVPNFLGRHRPLISRVKLEYTGSCPTTCYSASDQGSRSRYASPIRHRQNRRFRYRYLAKGQELQLVASPN